MSLSQHEQMILKGIEDEFAQQDPQLSAWLAGSKGSEPHCPRWVLLTVALALVLGIALVFLGKAAALPPVTRIGLAVAVLPSVLWMHIAAAGLLRRRRVPSRSER